MSADLTQLNQLLFIKPPPGLEPHTDFVLAQIGETPGLFSLTAATGGARLFLLDPAVYLPDYAPNLPVADLSALGSGPEGPWVAVVVNPGTTSTVNLSAPIAVNPATGASLQVILEDSRWPLRHPLSP